ncbi:MAG TPA: DUF4214 domain-containing protein [Pirellulales bacterium]|jgi:hypothetical protein|nr:DUF4214 domain-containing protein [Pirellulales bacterium]
MFEILEGRVLLSANVLSYHNDLGSTGQNLSETVLTPANVNASTFGRLATVPLDGQVYAQPLYQENVNITAGPDPGVHNVVFVATEHDSVYAIDANGGQVLWRDSFINTAAGVTTVPYQDTGNTSLTPEIGITSTPVVDPGSNTIYVLATTKEVRSDGPHYVYRLHALDTSSGAEKLGGPLTIGDTIYDGSHYTYVAGPSVAGSGDESINGMITFNALNALGRAGLRLDNGNVLLAFASHADARPAHGWIMAVNAQTLQFSGVLNTTPNGTFGTIWDAGNAITTDGQGQYFVATGNGTFDTTLNAAGLPANADFGDSIVKFILDPSSTPSNPNPNGWGLKIVDYFTPSNQQILDDQDLDLGSGGVTLLPPAAGSAADPDLLIQGGKQGTLYLMNRDNMPRFNANRDQVLQEPTGVIPSEFSSAAYFNGTLYYAALGDHAKAFAISNGVMATSPSAVSADSFGYPGSTPSVSANGTANGIVWIIDTATNQLRAYDAANLADELYTGSMGTAVKFSVPTIADGQVFVGGANSLDIFGLTSTPSSGGTPNQRYVTAAYSDVLGRQVDPVALSMWSGLLDQGLSRATFAYSLTHSNEYFGNVIEADYQRYLGRAADPAGLQAWTVAMDAGLTDEQLEANFIASPEFYAHAGGTDRAWVDAMYFDLLGRVADPVGEAEWIETLALGVPRSTVADDFAASPEREADRIQADYQQFLGRTANEPEVVNWVNAFRSGMTNENVVTGFVASDEFYREHSA